MQAVKCPVCNGNGLVSAGFYNQGGDGFMRTTATTPPEQCRSCGGKGWVEVSEEVSEDKLPEASSTGKDESSRDKCPFCGGDRNRIAEAGCPPGSHYGTYSETR